MNKDLIISKESFESGSGEMVVLSLIDIIKELLSRGVKEDMFPKEALMSFYVEHFIAYLMIGGLTELKLRTLENKKGFDLALRGLKEIGATKHLEYLERCHQALESGEEINGIEKLETEIYQVCQVENLAELNGNWLLGHQNIRLVSAKDLPKEITKIEEELKTREALN